MVTARESTYQELIKLIDKAAAVHVPDLERELKSKRKLLGKALYTKAQRRLRDRLAAVGGPVEASSGSRPAKAAKGKTKTRSATKMSALDAAAKVLAEAGQPLNCQEMIAAMAAKGYWTSPNGKTPHATLYSAILREINTQGKAARFVKTDRGKFAVKA